MSVYLICLSTSLGGDQNEFKTHKISTFLNNIFLHKGDGREKAEKEFKVCFVKTTN